MESFALAGSASAPLAISTAPPRRRPRRAAPATARIFRAVGKAAPPRPVSPARSTWAISPAWPAAPAGRPSRERAVAAEVGLQPERRARRHQPRQLARGQVVAGGPGAVHRGHEVVRDEPALRAAGPARPGRPRDHAPGGRPGC